MRSLNGLSWLGSGSLVFLLGGAVGCSRVRDIPIDELPKLNAIADRSATAVVVDATNGKRVRIESFSRLAVMRELCTTPQYCDEEQEHHVDELRRIRLFPDRIELEGRRHGHRGASPATHVIHLDSSKRWGHDRARGLDRLPGRCHQVLGCPL